jgi:acyl carrier protein
MLYKEIMKKEEILLQVQNIFRDILDNESIELTGETTANDVDEWDSLSHIQLIVAIEKQFKIKFTSREILSWKNVGEMLDSMDIKLGNA